MNNQCHSTNCTQQAGWRLVSRFWPRTVWGRSYGEKTISVQTPSQDFTGVYACVEHATHEHAIKYHDYAYAQVVARLDGFGRLLTQDLTLEFRPFVAE